MKDKVPAIAMEDVVFRYFESGKRNILDHVSLTIMEGTITVLMGSSGCGKSTLAAVLSGLYPGNGGYLQSGTIRLYGRPLEDMDHQKRAAYLTMMFQNPDLQFCMNTLRAEMQFCMENICIPKEEMDARIRRAASILETEALLDQPLFSLSGGEKQKAALCCLFVMDSKCILLDEAFANIDYPAAIELIRLLQKLKEEGRTIIAIDHRPDYWLSAADEIILLGDGARVLERGITQENLSAHRSLFEQEGLFFPEQSAASCSHSPRSDRPAITLEDVTICQQGTKKELLSHASASFPKAAVTAILGPSGSGKTTTFLSLLKQHPYTGTICLGDMDLARIKPKKLFSRIGIVFQNPGNQFVTQKVSEEIAASIRIWDKKADDASCQEQTALLLTSYGLKRYQNYSPYMLSQGQQRRLAVLSVLAGGQDILLLDEPTYGQDYRSVLTMMEQISQKVIKDGLTVILITHDRILAERWADKIYLLQDRQLTELQNIEEAM